MSRKGTSSAEKLLSSLFSGTGDSTSDELTKLLMLRALAGALGENDDGPKRKFDEAKVGDIIFVKFGSSDDKQNKKDRPALAKILKVEKDEDGDNIATCRIIGADCHSTPTIPVQAIPQCQFGNANISPVLKDLPPLDVPKIRAREMQRRRERTGPAPRALKSYREEDEEILFRTVRNIVVGHINDDPSDNAYSWSCKLDMCSYLTPSTPEEMANSIFNVVRRRVNEEVLKGTGLELTYFGPCTRRDKCVSFVIDEVPFEEVDDSNVEIVVT